MSGKSFIEKLLDGVEVEWKALGEVCDFKNGFAFKSALFKDTGLPIIRITNVDGRTINLSDVKYFNPEDYSENTDSYKVEYGDILIAMSGATTGKIGFYAHKDVAYLNQRVGKFLPKKDKLNNRYLYHYLLSKNEVIYVLAGGGAQPNLSSNVLMAKIKIPIPCPDNPQKSLQIQAEIVRMLDTFTELTTELTAELTARKKQYEYYRNQLLSFEEGRRSPFLEQLLDGVVFIELQDLFIIRNGYTPSKTNKAYWTDGTTPWFRMEDIRENGRILSKSLQQITEEAVKGSRLFPANSIIIATSATIGEHALITVPHLSNQRFTSLALKPEFTERLDMKFVFYYCFVLGDWCRKNTTTSNFSSVDMNGFKKFRFLLPPLEVQREIVRILDKFDALTNSITEGLPREIELRKKQYEYYRDLIFKSMTEKSV